ncbi:hypothetical protein [Bauldia litoralis]|uniref:hypothetical protein n=1 Tax=Bauldia litoralis TaxID=665467 RepID=UPI003266048A
MTIEGYAACLLWFMQALRHCDNPDATDAPDHALLTMGLPQGRILRASVEYDPNDGSPIIAVVLWDQRDSKERTLRFYDPVGFLALRLVILPKARIRVDHNVLASGHELHYVVLYDDITAQRILCDAKPGEAIEQRRDETGHVLDHHDLRLRNFVRTTRDALQTNGKLMGGTHQGRDLAIELALTNLDKDAKHLPLNGPFYAALLDEVFAFLDEMHAHEIG